MKSHIYTHKLLYILVLLFSFFNNSKSQNNLSLEKLSSSDIIKPYISNEPKDDRLLLGSVNFVFIIPGNEFRKNFNYNSGIHLELAFYPKPNIPISLGINSGFTLFGSGNNKLDDPKDYNVAKITEANWNYFYLNFI